MQSPITTTRQPSSAAICLTIEGSIPSRRLHSLAEYHHNSRHNHLAHRRDRIWEHPFSGSKEVEQVFLMTIRVEHYNIIRLWLELYDKKTPEEMTKLISDALALFNHFK